MQERIRYIGSLVLAALVFLFIVQNIAVVEVNFLFWSISISRAILLIIIFAVGMMIGVAVARSGKQARRRE